MVVLFEKAFLGKPSHSEKKVRHKNNKEKYRTLHCHLAQIPCSALNPKDSDIKSR